jgi:hypothetical protein
MRTDYAETYRIPLPASLERVTDPRALSITLAWSSPIRPGHQSYRCIKMGAEPDRPLQTLGVERRKAQPSDPSCKRGTLFHEHFEGESAVAFIDDGQLGIRVWCKEDGTTGFGQRKAEPDRSSSAKNDCSDWLRCRILNCFAGCFRWLSR